MLVFQQGKGRELLLEGLGAGGDAEEATSKGGAEDNDARALFTGCLAELAAVESEVEALLSTKVGDDFRDQLDDREDGDAIHVVLSEPERRRFFQTAGLWCDLRDRAGKAREAAMIELTALPVHKDDDGKRRELLDAMAGLPCVPPAEGSAMEYAVGSHDRWPGLSEDVMGRLRTDALSLVRAESESDAAGAQARAARGLDLLALLTDFDVGDGDGGEGEGEGKAAAGPGGGQGAQVCHKDRVLEVALDAAARWGGGQSGSTAGRLQRACCRVLRRFPGHPAVLEAIRQSQAVQRVVLSFLGDLRGGEDCRKGTCCDPCYEPVPPSFLQAIQDSGTTEQCGHDGSVRGPGDDGDLHGPDAVTPLPALLRKAVDPATLPAGTLVLFRPETGGGGRLGDGGTMLCVVLGAPRKETRGLWGGRRGGRRDQRGVRREFVGDFATLMAEDGWTDTMVCVPSCGVILRNPRSSDAPGKRLKHGGIFAIKNPATVKRAQTGR